MQRRVQLMCLSILVTCLQVMTGLPVLQAAETSDRQGPPVPESYEVGSVDRTAPGGPPAPGDEPGSPREARDLWTRSGRTYANTDGTYETVISPDPVNYRGPGGRWEPIDNSLVPATTTGYALRNAANDYAASRFQPGADQAPHAVSALGPRVVRTVRAQDDPHDAQPQPWRHVPLPFGCLG